MPRRLYFLKIGGSIITDAEKPNTPRRAVIGRIFKEIKEAKRASDFELIIGHGGGSFPHIPAKKYKVNDGLKYGFSRKGAAITLLAARKLNNIVVMEGLKSDLDVFPFSPSSFGVWEGDTAKTGIVTHIKEAIKRGMIPVVYGDVVINLERGVSIASTENVFDLLARYLSPDRIIIATDVDGVFDKDPRMHRDAKFIKRVGSSNIDRILQMAGDSGKINVTGGMNDKVSRLYKMVRASKSIGVITNGLKRNRIKDALLGRHLENSTVINP